MSDGIKQVENQTAIKMALVYFVFKAQYSRILANIVIFTDLFPLTELDGFRGGFGPKTGKRSPIWGVFYRIIVTLAGSHFFKV